MDERGVVYRHAHGKLHIRHRAENCIDNSRIRGDMFAVPRWGKDGGVDVQVGCVGEFLL